MQCDHNRRVQWIYESYSDACAMPIGSICWDIMISWSSRARVRVASVWIPFPIVAVATIIALQLVSRKNQLLSSRWGRRSTRDHRSRPNWSPKLTPRGPAERSWRCLPIVERTTNDLGDSFEGAGTTADSWRLDFRCRWRRWVIVGKFFMVTIASPSGKSTEERGRDSSHLSQRVLRIIDCLSND